MRFIYRLFYLFAPIAIFQAMVYAPPAEGLGYYNRIMFFHVPSAWVSVLAFLVAGAASLLSLTDKKKSFPLMAMKARNSAEIGFVFTILTLVSGSIWAKLSWGSFWNWDPRETSILILLLVYVAYFSLQSSLHENRNRDTISAVYLILAATIVPLLVFIIPRLYLTLHPDPIINRSGTVSMHQEMRIALLSCVITFTMLYFYLFDILNRISRIKEKIRGN